MLVGETANGTPSAKSVGQKAPKPAVAVRECGLSCPSQGRVDVPGSV